MTRSPRGAVRLPALLLVLIGLVAALLMARVLTGMADDAEEPQARVDEDRDPPSPTPRTPPRRAPRVAEAVPAAPVDTGARPPPRRATGTVRCAVDHEDMPVVVLSQVRVEPPGAHGEAAGTIHAGRIVLQVPTGTGSGVLTAHDTQIQVSWADVPEGGEGLCRAEVTRTYTAVFGTVTGWEAGWRGYATGCGGHAPIEDDGAFFATIVAEPCAMHAVVQHHGRVAHGPERRVDPSTGVDAEVTLRAPSFDDLRPLTDDELTMRAMIVELAEQLVENAGDPDADRAFLDAQRRDLEEAEQARDEDALEDEEPIDERP